MKKKLFLVFGVLAVLGAGFLLYAIPHGKRISSFELKISETKSQIESDASYLKGDRGIDSFCSALDNIQSLGGTFEGLSTEYAKIDSESNFLRNIWRTLKISKEDISDLGARIDALYSFVGPGVATVIIQLINNTAMSMSSAPSIDSIAKTSNEYASDLRRLSTSIQTFGQHIANPNIATAFPSAKQVDLSAPSRMKSELQGPLLVGLTSIRNLAMSTNQTETSAIEAARSVKEAIDIAKAHIVWIANAQKVASDLAALGAGPSNQRVVNQELARYGYRTKSDIELIERVIDSQKRSNDQMKNALTYAETANSSLQNLERFASSNQIAAVYGQWNIASNKAEESKSSLYFYCSNVHEQTIADNLFKESRETVSGISGKIVSHRNFVLSQYEEARREESTFVGSTGRAVQRGLDRLASLVRRGAEKVAESRIGKEITLSVKALILGTKAFYDLMDPNTDPISWAFSYQDDVDQLMNETDKVMRMEGPSITGKNTFIEDFVNRSYEKAFKKEDTSTQKFSNQEKQKEPNISERPINEIFGNIETKPERGKEYKVPDNKNGLKTDEKAIIFKEERAKTPIRAPTAENATVRAEDESQKQAEIEAQMRFADNGDGTITDTRTNLMWAAKDNGSRITISEALSYYQNYTAGGYNDWRMPTGEELQTLYDKRLAKHITLLITLNAGFVWCSTLHNSEKFPGVEVADGFNFGSSVDSGKIGNYVIYGKGSALPVRNKRD